ncbi:putative thioredoxin superfamily protein [Tanacetum coccineum]|uniref:Thioredoxin superfamily protein n=1 Tax=Tanacetum coccineum TaxID=301880 RepID=A0ABQ4XY56_9ASTR
MSKTTFSLAFLLILSCTTVLVRSQAIIPSRYDGFVYRKHAASTATVMIEAFYDPVCPDSRDSWAPLKQAVDHYGPRVVSLIVHTFPLPYHDNAFMTSRALHIVNELNASATYHLLDAFFKHQEQFYNAQTLNMSRETVLNHVIGFASSTLGNSLKSAITSGFKDLKTGTRTRVSFKYGCSRGVYGTPFFFVNGFLLPVSDDAIDYDGWRKIIDPLATKQDTLLQTSSDCKIVFSCLS